MGKYGPNTAQVNEIRTKIPTISMEQAVKIDELWREQDIEVWMTTWDRVHRILEHGYKNRRDFWVTVWGEIWVEDIRGEILEPRWAGIRDAVLAVLVRGLVDEEDFDVLYNPWRETMEVEK